MTKADGVYKRCGCVDPVTGRRWGSRCPRLAGRGHGSWFFSVELPMPVGQRCRLRRGGFRSRATAAHARSYWLGKDVDPDCSVVTVGQWLDLWLQTRHGLRPTTRRIYSQHVRDYLRPALGGVLLRDLNVGRVQAVFTRLLRTDGARNAVVAPSTLHRIRGVLRAALNAAIRRGLLTHNPARWVETTQRAATPCGGMDRGAGRALAGHWGAAGGGRVDRSADRPILAAVP